MTDALLERLMRLHPKLIDLELERIERLLARWARRTRSCRRSSMSPAPTARARWSPICAPWSEAAGYRVHVYTSPHLVRFNERIRVAGRLIEDDELDAVLTECERGQSPASRSPSSRSPPSRPSWPSPASRPTSPSSRSGMGGRLDTTNVVDPALSAITPIGYDHTGFLGDKLEGIAAEKAGILKHGVPAVIGRQREVSAEVIAAEAREARRRRCSAWAANGR